MQKLLGSFKDQKTLERILKALVKIPEHKLTYVADLLELITRM